MRNLTKVKIFNISKFILLTGFIVSAFNGCLFDGFRSAGSGSGTSPSQNLQLSGIQAFEKSVYLITRSKCINCHQSVQAPFHASSDLSTAHLAAKSRVTFANVPSSKLVIKTTDSHCGANCNTDGSEMTKAINFWKNYEKVDPSTGNGLASDSVLRSANRKFVATKLNDIFGSGVASATNSLIANDASRFGGPCNLYARDFDGDENYGDCNFIADSQAALIGPQTPARQALIVRVCQQAVANDTNIIVAVSKSVGSNVTNRAPSSGDIQSLYEIFNTGRVASSETLTTLASVGASAQQKGLGTMGAWRYILLALCQSPDWQVP